MKHRQLLNAVTHNVPAQRLFIKKTQQNPPSKFGEIRVLLNQRLRIQRDQRLNVRTLHPAEHRPTQLHFNLVPRQTQIQSQHRKINPPPQILSGPKLQRSILIGDLNK